MWATAKVWGLAGPALEAAVRAAPGAPEAPAWLPPVSALAPLYPAPGGLAAAFFDETAACVGVDGPTLKYVICLLAAIPVCLLSAQLPGGNARHAYLAATGIAMCQFIFGVGWLVMLAVSLVGYGLLCWSPRAKLGERCFVAVMAVMSGAYLQTMWRGEFSASSPARAPPLTSPLLDYLFVGIDYTYPLMVLVVKLSSTAYNLSDGTARVSYLHDKTDKISASERGFALAAPPPLLAWLGYVEEAAAAAAAAAATAAAVLPLLLLTHSPRSFTFVFVLFFRYVFNPSTCIAGPGFEYTYYDDATAARAKGAPPPPPRLLFAAAVLLKAAVLIAAYVLVAEVHVPVSHLAEEAYFVRPLWSRVAYLHLSIAGGRWKYYGVWKFAECAAICGGFGLDKATGLWSEASNIDCLGFETATNRSVRPVRVAWRRLAPVPLTRPYTQPRALPELEHQDPEVARALRVQPVRPQRPHHARLERLLARFLSRLLPLFRHLLLRDAAGPRGPAHAAAVVRGAGGQQAGLRPRHHALHVRPP